MNWLFRETYTSRWFHARLDRFLAKTTQLGLSADHVRCSHLAVRKKLQADGRACSTLDLAPFNPEYAVTTDALVATTTTIMLSRMAEESSESLNARGRALPEGRRLRAGHGARLLRVTSGPRGAVWHRRRPHFAVRHERRRSATRACRREVLAFEAR